MTGTRLRKGFLVSANDRIKNFEIKKMISDYENFFENIVKEYSSVY